MPRYRAATIAGLLAIVLIAVAPAPVAQAQERLYGAFLWFDLLTEDVEAAKSFYASMFGWSYRTEADTGIVRVVNKNGREIGAIFSHDTTEDETESQWIGSLSVPDVDGATDLLVERGGRVFLGPAEAARGRYSVVADPQGAVLALFHGREPDELPATLDHGDWFWPEMWGNDGAAAVEFYRELVGYEPRVIHERYAVMEIDGKAHVGVGQAPFEVRPHWLAGILVADIDDAQRAVEHFGGTVLIEASERFGAGSSVLAQDPTGAVFLLHAWNGARPEEAQ
jgi:predicted enzyme related to lactoylglutathione lyase